MNTIRLEKLASGQAVDLFRKELEKVFENIRDENTVAKNKRWINIKIDFKPKEDREIIILEISSTVRLVPQNPAVTMVTLKDQNGVIVATEATKKDLQDELFKELDEPEKMPAVVNE